MKFFIPRNKVLATLLGIVGFLLILYKMLLAQSECAFGEICDSKPPGDWKLKPFNGLDENHPIRRRFLEDKQLGANEEVDNKYNSGRNTQGDFLYDMFRTKDSPQKVVEKIVTKTEVKVKEVYIPQKCENELGTKPKYVTNCITNQIIGKIPPDLRTVAFRANQVAFSEFPAQETAQEREQSFSQVYKTNAWGKDWDPGYRDMNGSGRGATLSWTQELVATLHVVINAVKAHLGVDRVRLLDVPCGDMAWMSRFLLTRDDVDYTGVDIVPELIEHHKKAYKPYPWKFIRTDLLKNGLKESYDLILCRMLLQHLYFRDVASLLNQFSQSNSTFLLSTTFPGNQANSELVQDAENPGRFRPLNLEIPPLSLSPPFCYQRDGPRGDFEGWKHFIGLWSLPLTTVENCSHIHSMKYPGYSKATMHSCSKYVT